MLLIIEIAMLIGGVYAIVSGKVPATLIGGGSYQVTESVARIFGVLWVFPLPIVFSGALILPLFFGDAGIEYAGMIELVTVLGVALLSVVMIRVVGKPVEAKNDLEAMIANKAQGALIYALFSFTGFATVIGAPLAWIYANQVLKLIDEHGVGKQYRTKANTARLIAASAVFLWLVACVCIMTLVFTSS